MQFPAVAGNLGTCATAAPLKTTNRFGLGPTLEVRRLLVSKFNFEFHEKSYMQRLVGFIYREGQGCRTDGNFVNKLKVETAIDLPWRQIARQGLFGLR